LIGTNYIAALAVLRVPLFCVFLAERIDIWHAWCYNDSDFQEINYHTQKRIPQMNQTKEKRLRKLVFGAMFAALVFAATWISIPMVIGNINLGDGVLLLAAWMLGGPWAALAAAIGATLTDLVGGYAIYAPATFVIKALMVFVAIAVLKVLEKARLHKVVARVLSALAAELVMIVGYFVYEALVIGLGWGALVSIPFNAVQGAVAIVIASLLYQLLDRAGFKME
jgi:uncharacterized membrane protein